MSLDKMLRRRKRSVSPDEQASGGQSPTEKQNEESKQPVPKVEPSQSMAMIPQDRMEGIKQVANAFASKTGGFSMTDLLKMDDSQKGFPDVLMIPVGGAETDMYRMLERCRLTKHEMQVYTNAIHTAEHGLGYNYGQINLDFPVPFYGEYIVKKLRGSVSVDGESLGVFERTTSTWIAKLYAQQQQEKAQAQRGVIQ